jgi:2-desacetyl-2-hydroxyethyl bacteriochlorophyllide A dehydrogenase
MNTADSPAISIVIRAFNEERWLPDVLAAIGRQRQRDFEVLLVDSGSVDRTRDIAAAHGARIVQLRSDDFTFGHSLNVGIRSARGSFIAIVSAHAIPTDDQWLERLVSPLREASTAMVFGGQRGHAISKFSECRDFERVFPPEPQWMDDRNFFVNNANSAIRRDLWEQHPFDEGLPGLEDAAWAKYWMRRGKGVRYEPDACIIHVHTESWKQVRHRFHREGMAGRWAAIRLVRHIPREIAREVDWSLRDLWLASRTGQLRSHAAEIASYRYNKALGIVKGILDSRGIDNPSRRQELYFNAAFPAVVIRGRHDARLEQRSIPTLKPGEILVRVGFVGICGTDLEILEGRLGYYRNGTAKYPIVPGHECSGTVVSLGKKVTGLHEGDRVVVECIQGCSVCPDCRNDNAIGCRERREVGVLGLDGAYASYLITRARYAHRVPPNVSLADAALAEPLAVVMKGLRRLAASSPNRHEHRCAVLGAGTIGHLAARVLAQRGHPVSVIDRENTRLKLVEDIATTSTTLDSLAEYDWIVEATGNQGMLSSALERSRTGATLLLMGLPYGHRQFSFEHIVTFDKTVVGSVGSTAADFEEALATLPNLDTRSLQRKSYPLEEFASAWDAMRSRTHVKIMLQVDPTAV